MFKKIIEDKMKHILQVARQAYKIAKEKYKLSEEDCRKALLCSLREIIIFFCIEITNYFTISHTNYVRDKEDLKE